MNKLRNLSFPYFLSTILIALFLLAACGGSDEPEPTPEPTEAPTEAPAEVPTEAPEETSTPAPEPTTAPEPTAEPDDDSDGESDGESDNDSTETSASDSDSGLPDIYSFAASQPEISQFGSLIEQLDLVEKLQSEGPFTAFVPTNRALGTIASAVATDDELLTDLILHHIVASEIGNQDLDSTPSAVSLLGDELRIFANGGGAVVENANLLGVAQASNGILYIVDQIIYPPDLLTYALDIPSVAGEETVLSQGNLHISQGERTPIDYNTTPPTSGPHYGNLIAWQNYEEPIRYEQVVHNLEDAGVLIYYQCEEACPELFTEISEFAQPLMDAGRHLAVLPNVPSWTVGDDSTLHQDMGAPIAVVAWQKVLKMDEFDGDKVLAFIEAYEGIDHHARY